MRFEDVSDNRYLSLDFLAEIVGPVIRHEYNLLIRLVTLISFQPIFPLPLKIRIERRKQLVLVAK